MAVSLFVPGQSLCGPERPRQWEVAAGEKEPGYLCGAPPVWDICVGESGRGVKTQMRRKNKSFLLPPSPKFMKCTHILHSNVEKSHSGCAYKKVVVKKLCFYDDVPREDAGGHHLRLGGGLYQGLPGVCGVGDHKAKLEEPLF